MSKNPQTGVIQVRGSIQFIPKIDGVLQQGLIQLMPPPLGSALQQSVSIPFTHTIPLKDLQQKIVIPFTLQDGMFKFTDKIPFGDDLQGAMFQFMSQDGRTQFGSVSWNELPSKLITEPFLKNFMPITLEDLGFKVITPIQPVPKIKRGNNEEVLDLSGSVIDLSSCRIEENNILSSWRKIDLSKIFDPQRVEVLNLSDTYINSHVLKMIFMGIENLINSPGSVLSTLSFSNNESMFSLQGYKKKGVKMLTKLFSNENIPITSLDLSHTLPATRYANVQVDLIKNITKNCKNLTLLNLSNSKLSLVPPEVIVELLSNNKKLTFLDLSSCSLPEFEDTQLTALQQAKCLTVFNIDNNLNSDHKKLQISNVIADHITAIRNSLNTLVNTDLPNLKLREHYYAICSYKINPTVLQVDDISSNLDVFLGKAFFIVKRICKNDTFKVHGVPLNKNLVGMIIKYLSFDDFFNKGQTNFTGNGLKDHTQESYWYEYSKNAMVALLKLRIESSNIENVTVMVPNYIWDDNIEVGSKLLHDISTCENDKVLIPLNLYNKHWVGILVETNQEAVNVYYMDSEQLSIPALLKDTLSKILTISHLEVETNIIEAKVELQKYNNCGLEVIENFMYHLTDARISQEDALLVHSLLFEDSILMGDIC